MILHDPLALSPSSGLDSPSHHNQPVTKTYNPVYKPQATSHARLEPEGRAQRSMRPRGTHPPIAADLHFPSLLFVSETLRIFAQTLTNAYQGPPSSPFAAYRSHEQRGSAKQDRSNYVDTHDAIFLTSATVIYTAHCV